MAGKTLCHFPPRNNLKMSEKKGNSTISSTSGLNNNVEYIRIIIEAIKKLDRGPGCSRQTIAKYIKSKMKGVNEDPNFENDLDIALRFGVTMNFFYINTGARGSGAYKLVQDNIPGFIKIGQVSHKTPVTKLAKKIAGCAAKASCKTSVRKAAKNTGGAAKASCKTSVRKAAKKIEKNTGGAAKVSCKTSVRKAAKKIEKNTGGVAKTSRKTLVKKAVRISKFKV